MPTYDSTQFDPPAPLAKVRLRVTEHDHAVNDVTMLIDTGSDLTLIPERSVADLKLELDQNHEYELEGFDGRKTMSRSIRLELVFLGRTFKGRFVLINSDHGILGRNVLNHFAILFDGPGLTWQRR